MSGNEEVVRGLGVVSVTLKEVGEAPPQAKRSREKERAASTYGVLAVLRAVITTHLALTSTLQSKSYSHFTEEKLSLSKVLVTAPRVTKRVGDRARVCTGPSCSQNCQNTMGKESETSSASLCLLH